MTLEEELIAYAASQYGEACGLILNGDTLFRCANTHATPINSFRISDDDWLAAEEAGGITAVFHSHVAFAPYLSPADRVNQIATGLPWWLACEDKVYKFRPVPWLLGRKFEHGIFDCYTIFRDAYHLMGIDLPDFERKNQWWMRGENLYLKNMRNNGFYEICMEDAQPGDVILRQPFYGADPCHSMILLEDNYVLHHDHAGHLSRREPMRPAYMKQLHSVWRHEQCLPSGLAGIYADFIAKSI